MKEKSIWRLIIFVLGCELVGIAASVFTASSIPTWYATLIKPSFSPPNFVFAPVWTTLYALMGISLYLVFQQGWSKKSVREATGWFGLQLFLNFVWSFLFFGLQNPLLGLVDIVLLWLAIVVTSLKFYKLSKPAGYLLLPYLVWVTFASILNLSIVALNR